MKTRMPEDAKLVDRFNQRLSGQGISAHFEERASATQAVIDDYRGRVAAASAAGLPPPEPPPGIDPSKNASNTVLVVERRIPGGNPDEVKRTEFTYDSHVVNTLDPNTGALVQNPVLMIKNTMMLPALVVNGKDARLAPGLTVGQSAYNMGGPGDQYHSAHESALNILFNVFGDEGAAQGFSGDTINKRWEQMTTHLPTSSSRNYRGLEGMTEDIRSVSAMSSMIQFQRGRQMSPKQWEQFRETLPSRGYAEGPVGSSHANFVVSDEYSKRKNQDVVLATYATGSWQSSVPGVSEMHPGGNLTTGYKGANTPAGQAKAIAGAVKRERLRDRQGFIPDNSEVVEFPGIPGFRGFITVTQLGIKRIGDGGVDETGMPVAEGQVQYETPAGGGQGLASRNLLQMKGVNQVGDNYFEAPRDREIDIRNFRTTVGMSDTIPYTGGTLASWGRGGIDRERDPNNTVEFGRMGDLGGKIVVGQSISFGDDEQSAKFIKDLLGNKTPHSAAAIRSILSDQRSRDSSTPIGAERIRLEGEAVNALNELQVKRDYYDDSGALIPESDPRHAVEVSKAREKYRILHSAPGGKGAKTSYIVSAGYNSNADSIKSADRKIMINEIPTTPAAQRIIDQAGQATISGKSVELPSISSIENLVHKRLATMHEDTDDKFQEDSSGALQAIADLAAVSAYGPGPQYNDALARFAAGDASARDQLTLSNAASGLKAIPVIEHSIDEIKNTPDAHALTLAGYWHLGETGKYGKLPNSENDPMNVGQIYGMLKSRFGTVENLLKSDSGMIAQRESAFFELLGMSPQVGGRITYYQITPHVNVEPAGTKDTVNATSIEEIVSMARDQSFQEYLNRGNMDEMSQAARIISTVVPGGLHAIDITEDDLKVKTIPEYRQAEADDRFYALREIYDSARKREEKRTGKTIGKYTAMRFSVPGYADEKSGRTTAEQLVVASPYSFQGLERSAGGETLVRFAESIQNSSRQNIIDSNPFDLHNIHMEANIEYATSPGGQKALQNFSGPIHGVAMRYGFSPIVQGEDVLIGPHHAAIFAPIFGFDDPHEFWKRVLAGEEFILDEVRFPQALGKQGRGRVRGHPDFMGPPSISQKTNLAGLGDFDGDLEAFMAAQKRMYFERDGKEKSQMIFLPGMDSSMGEGASNARLLSALASFYNPDELKEIIDNARNVVGQYMDNDMMDDPNFVKAFEAQYGINPKDKKADKDALEVARKVEIDRLAAHALVSGMDVIGNKDRRYIVPGLDIVFAGKSQRIETDMTDKLLPVDLRKSDAEGNAERLEITKKATRAVEVSLTPEKAGSLLEEEQIGKKEMGVYTPISALQGVMKSDKKHLEAIDRAAKKEFGTNELEQLVYASNPGGWYTSSYSGQAMQALSLNYQRSLDMLEKPDSFKRYSKDFFVTDILGWQGNRDEITENAMMSFLQTEEISPLAFASAFAQKENEEHIGVLLQQSKALKEKIKLSREAAALGKGEEMTTQQIRATSEWKKISRGEGVNGPTERIGMGMIDSMFTRMFQMQSIHNTLKGIEEGRYAESASVHKKKINQALDDIMTGRNGQGGIENDPEKMAQFLDTAGKSRNRNLVGFLMSSFRNAAGLPENYKSVLSKSGMSMSEISQAMEVKTRLDESPSRLETAMRGISRDSFNEIFTGNINEAWMNRLKENFDLLPMGPANQKTRYQYFRGLGLPVQWKSSDSAPYWSNRASLKARPSGLDAANFAESKWMKYVFGGEASVYSLGAAHGAVNQAIMRMLVPDRKNPGLVDKDALSNVDADLFTKNKYSVTVQRNNALVGGNQYERGAIKDLIGTEASDPDSMYLPMGGYGFFAGDKVSGVELAGSADLFKTTRDPKTGQLSVTVFDLKATRLKGAIANSSWSIPGREYHDDRPISGAELENVIPSDEFGPYSLQEEAYKYLAVAQTIENRRKLAEEITEKRRKEHDAKESAAEASAIASGTTYTKSSFVETPVTEKDFDLTGEHSTSDYAKMIEKWAGAIASGRTGIRVPINDKLRKEWEDRGEDKRWKDEKNKLFPHVQEMFEAISEGRIETGGVIIPNQNDDGTFVVDDEVKSVSGNGFSVTPIVGKKHAIVSTRHMDATGPNSFQGVLNKYPVATQDLLLKAGPYHLSMIAKSLDQVMKNRNVFMGLDRETGEVNASGTDGSDLSALFSDQIRNLKRKGSTTMAVADASAYQGIDDLETTSGVLGAIQQATGFSSRDLAKMEHALRGYERERVGTDVKYKKLGNAVVGDDRSGPAILSEDRSGTWTDADLREVVVAMATQRGARGSRTRTITAPTQLMPREVPSPSEEWIDTTGIKRSPLEVVAGSVREMLSPSGDTPAEQLVSQQKAFNTMISNSVFKPTDFVSPDWTDAYAEPDEKTRVEKLSRMAGRLMAQEYEGEYENISPPWATMGAGNNPFGANSSGGVYFRVGKNTTLYAINPQIAGIKGGLDAAKMVTNRMMHAITQINIAKARGIKPGASSVRDLDAIPHEFEDIKTAIGEVLVPKISTMPMERLVVNTAREMQAQMESKGGEVSEKLRQMSEENERLFENSDAGKDFSTEFKKYLNSDKIKQMYSGVEAFPTRPDHRGWFWDRHLRLMSAVTETTTENILADNGGTVFDKDFKDFRSANPRIFAAMVFGHDLMKAQTTQHDKKDYEDDKTPAVNLAREMGLSDEEAEKVGRYLTLSDEAKKGLSKSEIEALPWEVRLLSTIDSVVHAASGPQGFYNIYSTTTWQSQNRGEDTRLLEIAEGNEKKLKKDDNKILMNMFRRVTKRRGLFGIGPETTQTDVVKSGDITGSTELLYNPRTKETHVSGVATDVVRSSLLDLKEQRDAHYAKEHEKFKTEEGYQIQKWDREDIYSGQWLDEMLADMPEREDPLLSFDKAAKKMRLFDRKGKMHGGSLRKGDIDIVGEVEKESVFSKENGEMIVEPGTKRNKKETVGEFGQEIISPGEDGELYVSPNSAIKRKDSESYRSQQRILFGFGIARHDGGPVQKETGAVVGETSEENWEKEGLNVATLGVFKTASERMLGIRADVEGINTVQQWSREKTGENIEINDDPIEIAKNYFSNLFGKDYFDGLHGIEYVDSYKEANGRTGVFMPYGDFKKKIDLPIIKIAKRKGKEKTLDVFHTVMHEIGHYDEHLKKLKDPDYEIFQYDDREYIDFLNEEAYANIFAEKYAKEVLPEKHHAAIGQRSVWSQYWYERWGGLGGYSESIYKKDRLTPVWHKPHSRFYSSKVDRYLPAEPLTSWEPGAHADVFGRDELEAIYLNSNADFLSNRQLKKVGITPKSARADGGPIEENSMYVVGELAEEKYLISKDNIGYIEPVTVNDSLINSSKKSEEIVGQFGQEIIVPGENGELYSTFNSAIPREETDQMKSSQRIQNNVGSGRARGGPIARIGASLIVAAEKAGILKPSTAAGMSSRRPASATPSTAATPSVSAAAPATPSPSVTPTVSASSGLGGFLSGIFGKKSSAASASSARVSPAKPPTRAVSASTLPGLTSPSPTASVATPKTAEEVHAEVLKAMPPSAAGLVLAGHSTDAAAGVPAASLAALTATATAEAFKAAGIAFGGGGSGPGGLAGGSSVSRTKADKWKYNPYAMRELFTVEEVDETTGAGTGKLVAKDMINASGDIDLGWTNPQITTLLAGKNIGTSEASGIASLQAISQRGRRSTLEDLNRGVKMLEEWVGTADPDSAESKGMVSLLNRVKDMRSAKIASMGSLGSAFSMSYDEIKTAGEAHNKAFGSNPLNHDDAKKAMNSFTEQLFKSTDFLKALNSNLGEMVKTTKGAESVYRELATNYERQKQWVNRAKEQGIGETEEGRKVLGAAEFELSVMEGQLQHGSDLYKEVASVHGTEFADRMVAEARGKKSSRKGMLTAHFLHEMNRAGNEAVRGAFASANQYAQEVKAERGILAPIQENIGQVNERGLMFENARSNWNRSIGANVSSALGGLYNMDSGVASALRAGSQIAAPAMSAMMFASNIAQIAPGSIGTKGILGAGAITAILGTVLNAAGVAGDDKEMASNRWIERFGGSNFKRDAINTLGYTFRKGADFVNGPQASNVALSRDEMIRAEEKVKKLKKGEYDIEMSPEVYEKYLANLEEGDLESFDRFIEQKRRIKAGVAPGENDVDSSALMEIGDSMWNFSEMEKEGFSMGTVGKVSDYKKILTAEEEARAAKQNFSDASYRLISSKNWEVASRELTYDQVNVMTPFDPKKDVSEMMADANRSVSPVALALRRDTFVGRPGQESYNQYRQYGLSLGLSDSQITMADQYAQMYAGAPGTPIFSAAYRAFSDRTAYGEDLGQTVGLAREIGSSIGNMSFLGDAGAVIGRNYTGTLLSQEQLYGVAANTKMMNMSQVLSAFAPTSSMTFGQLQQATRSTYMQETMTPDIAQYQSNKAALIAAGTTLEDYNKLHGTNLKSPNFNLIDYGKIVASGGITSEPTPQQSYDSTRMQIRSDNLPARTFDDPNRKVLDGVYPDMTFATIQYGEQSRKYAEALAKAPTAAEIVRGRNPLPKTTRVTPGAHRAMSAFASAALQGNYGDVLKKTEQMFGEGYVDLLDSLFKEDQTGTSVEAIARVAMGDEAYISGMNWNATSPGLKAAFEGVGIVPTIDSTTGQPMFQSSMHNARIPGTGPGTTSAVQSPVWNPKKGIEGWKSDLRQMGTVAGTRKYFDSQATAASNSGMKSVWSSLGSSEKNFYSRLAAGDVMTRMVGGQETPLAGNDAFQAYAQYTAAQSQLASAGANIANLKANRKFELEWSQPMEKYQREQKKASMFGGKVESPFGNGTLDFGKGRFEYQRMEMDIQKRDMLANFSQGMTRLEWQSEDLTRNRGRQLTQADWQMQDFAFQRKGQLLNRGMQEYNFNFQKREMDLGKQAYREDFAYNKRMSQMQFGWQMEDADINIRRATGFERRQLVKQKERQVVAFNAETEQNEKVNKRQEDAFKRQEEKFSKEIEHYKQTIKLENQQYDASLERFKKQQEWNEEDFNIQMNRNQQEKGWLAESFARQMERFELEKEQFELDVENQAKLAEDEKEYQEAAWKLSEEIYKNNLAAAGAAAMAAKAAAVAAEKMDEAAGDTKRGVEIMTRFFQDTRWDEVGKAMDKIIEMWTLINKGKSSDGNTGNTGQNTPPPPDEDEDKIPAPRPSNANGGYINHNRSALVGEHGPEIITVDKNGKPFVIPNSAIPRGQSNRASNEVIHIHVMMDSNEIATYTAGKAAGLASRNRRRAFNG